MLILSQHEVHSIHSDKEIVSTIRNNRQNGAGCPFALDLQEQLDIMKQYLPNEYKKCWYLWGPVYEEYQRIGYRLKKKSKQMSIFDLEEEKNE